MAETRTIRTVLELNAQRFTTGAAQASASAKSLAGELAKVGDAQGAQRANFDRVSNSLLGVGTAAAAGLGMAAKASMDWESSWAGVLKTVDGSPAQLKAVEDGLRGLARELPASHQEIAAVAEAAGQLGVETGSVVEFTRTMINLGETTNLSAEEAATSLARFSNIMGTSQDDVDRLGSTLVGLGNNFATTEGEIMAMGMRLSGIGAQLGLTEGDVLGLAAAMSSVGIEAEAGGTAMTMGMKKIDSAVREGGESLAGFAEVAGMSNEEFAKLWSEDSAAGLEAFVHGLANAGAEGESMSAVLSDLGIKGIREADTFLRLAANAEGMSEALAQGNTEFERNIALVEEAAKRYETTESQLQLARNAIVDAGIDLGATILPVLADAAQGVADLASWFGALPAPVQTAVTQLGGMVAVTGLVGGGLMRLIPAAMDTVNAFRDLRATSPAVASALGRVGKAVAITGVALTGLSMLSDYGNSLKDFAIGANEAADMAMKTADAVDPLQHVFAGMGEETYLASASTEEMAENLSELANGSFWGTASDKAAGLANAFGANISTLEDSRKRLEEFGQGLAGLAQTDLPAAQAAFENLWKEGFGGTEEAGQDLLRTMPALRDELIGIANAAELPTDDLTLLKIATGEIVPEAKDAAGAMSEYSDVLDDATDSVDDQVAALTELQDVLQGTADLLLGFRGSARDFESAIDDATAAVEENGKTLDITTEAGRANEAALDAIADATHRWADAAEESGESAETLDGIMRDGREAFIDAAVAMDMPREKAEELADRLQLIPDFVETEVAVETEAAEQSLSALNAAIDDAGGTVTINGDTMDAETALDYLMGTVEESDGEITINGQTIPAEEAVDALIVALGETDGVVTIDADTGPARHMFDGLVSDYPPDAEVGVTADIEPAMEDIYILDATIADSGGSVTINGDATPGHDVLNTLMEIINGSGGEVTIDGETYPAEEALGAAIDAINRGEGTVTIEGNNQPANKATDSAKRHADGTTGTIDVDANTGGAESSINTAARNRTSTITGSAQTGSAESALNRAARTRTARIVVSYSDPGFKGSGGSSGFANGGWLNRGLNAGGWVPGPYPGPGIDNVLWPVRSGLAGGGLQLQPLAGTEFVVNGRSARQWGPALEAINSGMSSSEVAALIGAQAGSAGVNVSQQISGLNAYEVARESRAQMQHVLRDAVPTLSR